MTKRKTKQPAAVVCEKGGRCKGTHPLICETHGCSFAVGRAAAAEKKERETNAERVRSSALGRPLYVGSVKDYRDKSGVRGGIYDLNRPQEHQLIFTVWGSSLKEMRRRKHWLLETLKKEERPTAEVSDGGPLTHDSKQARTRRSLH